jgi:phosphatidylserine/phosphatidylglycerophosphate/cardiolipin synthase-like enzyme
MPHVHRIGRSAVVLLLVLTGTVLGTLAPAGASTTLQHYTPQAGVLLNNPLTSDRRVIIDHLIKSINSVPAGQKIRIASWNLRSGAITQALMDAHHRGVSVRVIVDYDNANPDNPNANYDRLHTYLPVTKTPRPDDMTSWAVTCHGACRARGGIAHTKMFLFSQVGTVRNVVMFGSANATDLAAGYQWNDLYTMVNKSKLFAKAEAIFDESALDKPVAQPLQHFTTGPFNVSWYPYKGKNVSGDPVLKVLNRVRCAGATGGTGIKGHTSVRIAMTAMHGDRGLAIGQRLRTMWDRGCNIRIVYTLLGNKTRDLFRRRTGRGPLPMQQIVQDFDGDGVYDRYLHLKAMAVSGVFAGNTRSTVTWMGSSNWTALSLDSDEMGMMTTLARVRTRYSNWVDYLFTHPPHNPSASTSSTSTSSASTDGEVAARRFDVPEAQATRAPAPVRRAVDPYAQVQLD